MKNWVVFLMIISIAFSISSCSILSGEYIAETEGTRIYDMDYIKKYESTFNVMFDNDWKVIATENKYHDPEEICDHVDTRPQQYVEWTIQYHDGDGKLQTFTFDNRTPLSDQIQEYIGHYIADYYKENFYDVRMKDMPLAPSSYVFGFLTRMSTNRDEPENKERVKKSDKYLKKLDTPKGAICLSKLTPANVFEMCPIYLSINVSFSGHPDDKKGFEERAKREIENMIADMNAFTDNHLNADISMGYQEIIYLENGNRDLNWYYVQGKQIYDVDPFYYERHVFDGYKGKFW